MNPTASTVPSPETPKAREPRPANTVFHRWVILPLIDAVADRAPALQRNLRLLFVRRDDNQDLPHDAANPQDDWSALLLLVVALLALVAPAWNAYGALALLNPLAWGALFLSGGSVMLAIIWIQASTLAWAAFVARAGAAGPKTLWLLAALGVVGWVNAMVATAPHLFFFWALPVLVLLLLYITMHETGRALDVQGARAIGAAVAVTATIFALGLIGYRLYTAGFVEILWNDKVVKNTLFFDALFVIFFSRFILYDKIALAHTADDANSSADCAGSVLTLLLADFATFGIASLVTKMRKIEMPPQTDEEKASALPLEVASFADIKLAFDTGRLQLDPEYDLAYGVTPEKILAQLQKATMSPTPSKPKSVTIGESIKDKNHK